MNIVVDEEPQVAQVETPLGAECAVVTEPEQILKPLSFRQCGKGGQKHFSVRSRNTTCTWNQILTRVQEKKPTDSLEPVAVAEPVPDPVEEAEPVQATSPDRRAFPRHASEAIVLAFGQDAGCEVQLADHPGAKGYAINVSQNGLSFASRAAFTVREQLQLHVEDLHVNFALDVAASVVRVTPLDNEFWRIDCKLVSPLSDQQVALLKEHVPSCYAG